MPITRLADVDILDGNGKEKNADLAFVGSPGNILSSDAEPDVTVDGKGCTIIPGLIDSKLDSGPSEYALPLSASHGTTTAIDGSSSSSESQALRSTAAKDPVLPFYLASGSAIGPEKVELVSMLNYSGIQTVKTPREARRLVEAKILSHQADFIKIIVDQPGLEEDIIEAAVEETHRRGKLAVAQSCQVESYSLAVEYGFDILSPVPVDGELDPELIERIVSKGLGIIPTLCFLQKAIPVWNKSRPDYQFSYALEAVRALNDAGARICAGSSSNNWANFSLPFGKGLHNELQLLAKAGVSNEKLFKAVTSEPASLFHLADRGVIRPGRVADLVMVEGDPLKDIRFLSKIRSTWLRGIPRFDRDSFSSPK
ncbi:hypothetical protein E4U43_001512 [Claviceps pusilla]|uniref:Amidohydrolase-related domain-containing protein n=1 Tax=Claviceps pusilla TaxID=123648 RepID=A0A9P7N8D8_9HYPO|nr:hypothetical protein E4U43_001512 [Claviceps pusilla]